jgi:hypothetical protein
MLLNSDKNIAFSVARRLPVCLRNVPPFSIVFGVCPVRNFRVRCCRYITVGTDVIKVTAYDVAVFIHT